MENFTYYCPTKIIFGKGTEELFGEEAKRFGKKALLHYGGGSIKRTGLYGKITDSLKNAGIEYIELPGVVPNPRLSMVREGIELCRKNGIEFILAVGGGSVIDSAKAIAAGVPYEGDVWDFFSKDVPIEKTLPVGVVLTIAAAGSESSGSMVITNEDGPVKGSAKSDLIRPGFAILDPELTFSVPKPQTAYGIIDMMAHVFERYFTNTKSVGLTDELCEATLRAIISCAKTALENPDDYSGRANLMWAGTLAHNGLLGSGREGDWASHGIEHQLSAYYDIPHGAGLAVVFPAWMKYVYKHDIARFARFARKVWGVQPADDEAAALEGIRRTEEFCRELGLPTRLKELGIDNSKFREMAESCVDGGQIGNFVKLSPEDIVRICELALE